jgi:FdrA protein
MRDTKKIQELFRSQLVAINIGPSVFGEALEKQGIEVLQVDWQPPAGGDKQMQDALASIGGF